MFKKLLHLIRRDGLWYTIKRALAYAIARTPLAPHLSFAYYHGTRLTFSPALLTYQLFANRATRSSDVAVFAKFLKPGDTVIDVGANIGSLTTEVARIDFLKVDVEGYEYHVLQGAAETLKKTTHIYIEFIPELFVRGGSSPEQVLALLTPHFALYTLSPTLELIPFTYNAATPINTDLLGIHHTHVHNV